MKQIVCISNQREDEVLQYPLCFVDITEDSHLYLTIGKAYTIIPTMRFGKAAIYDDWLILDDSHSTTWYNKNLFMSLEEYRQMKLEQLI
jgi:hypothetical protein